MMIGLDARGWMGGLGWLGWAGWVWLGLVWRLGRLGRLTVTYLAFSGAFFLFCGNLLCLFYY